MNLARGFADRETIFAEREHVSVVAVEIVDAQGRLVPVASNEVSFKVFGHLRKAHH